MPSVMVVLDRQVDKATGKLDKSAILTAAVGLKISNPLPTDEHREPLPLPSKYYPSRSVTKH